jgi:hypothetical protein
MSTSLNTLLNFLDGITLLNNNKNYLLVFCASKKKRRMISDANLDLCEET